VIRVELLDGAGVSEVREDIRFARHGTRSGDHVSEGNALGERQSQFDLLTEFDRLRGRS